MVASANSSEHGSGLSVMVSDVRDQYADSLETLLRPHGFTIRRVGSGADAIDLAERRAVDAAVLDNDLPDIPGVRVLRIIRSRNPGMPIILVGSQASEQEQLLRTALSLEAFSVLSQPVDLEVLMGQMARLFERFFGPVPGLSTLPNEMNPSRVEPTHSARTVGIRRILRFRRGK